MNLVAMAQKRREEEQLADSAIRAEPHERVSGYRNGKGAERKCPKCGRRTTSVGPVCSRCKNGRAPPVPPVALLTTAFLIECAHELRKRQAEIANALKGES